MIISRDIIIDKPVHDIRVPGLSRNVLEEPVPDRVSRDIIIGKPVYDIRVPKKCS